MLKKCAFVFLLLFPLTCLSVSAQELTMKTLVVSPDPFIVEEQFFDNGQLVASLKVKLTSDEGGQKIPIREIMETSGTIPDGVFKEYYPGGQVQFSKAYKNGLKDGPSLEYYEDGTTKREVNYTAEKKQGEMKEYYPDGTLQTVRRYVDNEHEGVTLKYFPDGKLESELTYDRGATAWWKTKTYDYYLSGSVRSEYILDDRSHAGTRKLFFENGALWKSLEIKGGKLMNCQEFDNQGNLLSKQEGNFNGKLPSYYATGELMQEDEYADGEVVGFKMYDLQGNVMME